MHANVTPSLHYSIEPIYRSSTLVCEATTVQQYVWPIKAQNDMDRTRRYS